VREAKASISWSSGVELLALDVAGENEKSDMSSNNPNAPHPLLLLLLPLLPQSTNLTQHV
jgi:hypothetical protein